MHPLEKDPPSSRCQIDYRTELSYQEMVTLYFLPNKPVLLSSDFTSQWKARREWVNPSTGELNAFYFRQQLGDVQLTVTDCRASNLRQDGLPQEEMPFSTFMDSWMLPERTRLLYAKDWHFVRNTAADIYEPLQFFQDDWLNLYWDTIKSKEDDYRFCYIGMKGTWTPFHADVYRSYSWSTNICGIKRWYLCPPEQLLLIKRPEMPQDIRGLLNEDQSLLLVVDQYPGETLFVPSNWFHQVHNLTDALSINHNFCNAFNIQYLYEALCQSEHACREEIKHLKNEMDQSEFEELVQQLLRAHHGMNSGELQELLITARQHIINANCLSSLYKESFVLDNETVQDWSLKQIQHVLKAMERRSI